LNKHVIDDASRCLQCGNPMCIQGCPVNTPIKEAIRLLLNSDVEQAGKILFENNPLSLVCCHVCPQENQCEGHCVLGKKSTPVQISAIEQYISDYYLSIQKPRASAKTTGKVAIVGSGPAGITIAFLLAQKDYDVTVFEGNSRIGGILRYGIPEFRLPKRVLDRLLDTLLSYGVKFRPNTQIGTSITIEEMFRDGYNAIFIGTGVWRPLKLNIKGESLGHVHYAVEYLREPDSYHLGNSLVIIGAGNAAMDVARTALRQGVKNVVVVCNRGESTVTARKTELQYAKIEGVRFLFNKTAVEFAEGGVIFADSKVCIDECGYETAEPIAGTEQLMEADSAIIAISQGPKNVIVSSTEGLRTSNAGLVVTDDCGRTTKKGVFASGDVVTGAKTVVEAVRVSKRVAEAIDEYCGSGRWENEG